MISGLGYMPIGIRLTASTFAYGDNNGIQSAKAQSDSSDVNRGALEVYAEVAISKGGMSMRTQENLTNVTLENAELTGRSGFAAGIETSCHILGNAEGTTRTTCRQVEPAARLAIGGMLCLPD